MDKVYILCRVETGADHNIYDKDIFGVYSSKEQAEYNRNLFMIDIDANDLQIIEKELNANSIIKDLYASFNIKFELDIKNRLYSYYNLDYTGSNRFSNKQDVEPNDVKYSFTDNDCKMHYTVRLSNFDNNLPYEELKKKAKELVIEKTQGTIKELLNLIDDTYILIDPRLDDKDNVVLLDYSDNAYSDNEDAVEAYSFIIESFNRRFSLSFSKIFQEDSNTKFTKEKVKHFTNIIQNKMNMKFPDIFNVTSNNIPNLILKKYIAEDSYNFFKFT